MISVYLLLDYPLQVDQHASIINRFPGDFIHRIMLSLLFYVPQISQIYTDFRPVRSFEESHADFADDADVVVSCKYYCCIL